MAEPCSICERRKDPNLEFCALHGAALKNLQSGYCSWSKAFDGKLTEQEYYRLVFALPETGKAVRDVIQHISESGQGN